MTDTSTCAINTQVYNEENNLNSNNETCCDVIIESSDITRSNDDISEINDEICSDGSIEEQLTVEVVDDTYSEKSETTSPDGDSMQYDDADPKKGWRKPKSRTVMPAGGAATVAGAGAGVGGAGGGRSPRAHDSHDAPNDDAHAIKDKDGKKKSKNKEDPSVLIEGVLFRARYLGSTQLACEGQPTKATRMLQAEEAVSRIKCTPHPAT